ncbi:MAG: aspartyl protease family protein [Ferruginibacter sp.]
MRNIKCFIIFIFLPACIYAQELLPTPQAKLITKFPFRVFSGGVMVVKATFENQKDTFNFILDTGSGGISLDSSTCSDYKIAMKETDTTITGIGGIRKVSFVFNKKLHFPGLTLDHLNFHVNNYEVLSSVYGEKVDGIIGYSFFSRYIIQIDFDSLLIKVFSPGKIIYPKNGTTLHPVFTSLPILYMHIKDRRKMDFNFYFDTGAGLCFLMSEQFAKDSNILISKRRPLVTQAEGMLGRLEMRLTVIKEVKVGPYRFFKVPTYLYQDNYNVTSYPFSGGLVGNELLRRFNMIFNYPQREIHLSPNSHFDEPFDYAYTGLGIYFIDDIIKIVDVIRNSPGDKAGFKVDDEIIGVGNNISNNIQQYKNLLQRPNMRIRIIIRREDKLKELILNTKSIL